MPATLSVELEWLQTVSLGHKTLCHIFAQLLQFPKSRKIKSRGVVTDAWDALWCCS